MPTLNTLLKSLAEELGTSKRPARYFDVPKRGKLSAQDVKYVKQRFKELVDREVCVKQDPDNPKCYQKTKTDRKPRKKKRKASYLKDYEDIYRQESIPIEEFYSKHKGEIPRGKAPKGLKRISVETGLPLHFLKEVYDIGIGAYASSGSRTGMSAEQWGYGRVYAFIMSYFHNENGEYNNLRYLKNRTDFHIFEEILEEML
jgi:hypothetical protein